jgi:hypothetical protein
VILAEVNCRPFHFYWVRSLCRFHTRLLGSNSPLLVDVAKADAALAAEGSGNCWSAEFGRALESIACKAGVVAREAQGARESTSRFSRERPSRPAWTASSWSVITIPTPLLQMGHACFRSNGLALSSSA